MNDVLWVLTDACYRGKLKEVIHLLSGDHVDVNEFFKVPRLDVQWTPLTSAAMGGCCFYALVLASTRARAPACSRDAFCNSGIKPP